MGVKRNQAATGRRTTETVRVAILILTSAMIVVAAAAAGIGQPASQPDADRSTVAVDPGHGGRDPGGRGTAGTLEKEVCLALARELTHLMEPDHRIIMTRTGDYNITLPERAAIANHQKADIFLSLHTGASYRHSTNDIIIYYYRPTEKSPDIQGQKEVANPWRQIQMAHLAASKELAQSLKNTLSTLPGQPAAKVIQAPLLVLQGADMPAVAIEAGHLTHPATENALKSPEYQATLARAIAKGVKQFLSTRP